MSLCFKLHCLLGLTFSLCAVQRIRASQRHGRPVPTPKAHSTFLILTVWVHILERFRVAAHILHVPQKIFTDEDVRNIKNMDAIEKCVVQLTNLAASLDITFPDPSLELVLKLVSEKDPHTKKKQFHYYFVDLNKKLLFWLSDCQPMGVFKGLKGVTEPTHISKFTWRVSAASLVDAMVYGTQRRH